MILNPTRLQEILDFSTAIEDLVRKKRLGYLEAVQHHCEVTGLEYDLASKMLSDPLRLKIEREARTLHLIKDDRIYESSWAS